MIPQTKISILMMRKCGSCRLWDLDSIVAKVMCKLPSKLGGVEHKLIELLRQWNLNSTELVCDSEQLSVSCTISGT